MDQSHSAHCDAVLVTSLEAARANGTKRIHNVCILLAILTLTFNVSHTFRGLKDHREVQDLE